MQKKLCFGLVHFPSPKPYLNPTPSVLKTRLVCIKPLLIQAIRVFCRPAFTAATLVHTDEGQKPIAEIKEGHKVFAEDPETGEQGYFEVVEVRNHPKDELLLITLDTDEIELGSEGAEEPRSRGAGVQGSNFLDTDDENGDNNTQQLNSNDNSQSEMNVTPEHPVYVEGKGWLWAENLSLGDRLRRSDGGMARVLAIERVELNAPELVYNFTVKGPHTYFVLEAGVLVHNAGKPCGALNRQEGIWNKEQARKWDQHQPGNRQLPPESPRTIPENEPDIPLPEIDDDLSLTADEINAEIKSLEEFTYDFDQTPVAGIGTPDYWYPGRDPDPLPKAEEIAKNAIEEFQKDRTPGNLAKAGITSIGAVVRSGVRGLHLD